MYRIRKTDLVLLHSRGKVHKIIHNAIAEDTDMEWSVIKKKVTSNYGSTQSGINAGVDDIDEADAYHICNRLLKVGLKSRML